MRLMQRNKQTFWYQEYLGEKAILDEDGLDTGKTESSYGNPVMCKGVISIASGWAEQQVFGNVESYDRVITLEDHAVPITEVSRIYITKPEIKDGVVISQPDFIVRRVADSLNFRFIAIGKVALNADNND